LFSVISSFVTIFITSFLSLLLYEDVISKEADKIRKNLEKLINEKFQLIKAYQHKLKRGLMIIKTLITLNSQTKKNKINRDCSDLQIFLKSNNYLPISSPKRKKDNYANFFFNKDDFIKNDIIKYNEENLFNKFSNSNIEQTILIPQNIYDRETNIVEISTSRNLILNKNKKRQKRNNFVRNNFKDIYIFENYSNYKIFEIINAENYQYLTRKKELNEASNVIKYFYLGNRNYIFPGNYKNISCSEVYIIKNKEISVPKHSKKVYLKIYLIFVIFFVILFYLMILIQNIQTKYGNNFLQLCVLPFFTTLLIKYLFKFNFMMLITSIILYYFGEYFINNKKVPLYIYYISKAFLSPVVMNHYYAIKLYQNLK